MKKNTYLFSLALCGSILVGCSDEKPEVNNSNYLTIQTSIPNARALKTAFAENDEMAVYVKSAASLTAEWYNDVAAVCKATYRGGAWSLAPNVVLNSNTAYVYAYYPFSSLVTDPEAVPVSTTAQLDYLYGGSANTASSTVNTLALNMAHSQTNFRFNVINVDYGGVGVLKSICIANKSGKTTLYTEGTLNIATGQITGKSGANTGYTIGDINKTVEADGGWITDLPSAMVIPFNPEAKGDIEFIIELDERTFVIECPTQVNGYVAGQQYTFNLKLSGRSLVLEKNDITIEPWGDNSIDLGDVVTRGNSVIYTLTTKLPNQTITLPMLNISTAKVAFGDGQSAIYAANLQYTYAVAGTYQVTINTESEITRATFSNMNAIDELDLSGIGSE